MRFNLEQQERSHKIKKDHINIRMICFLGAPCKTGRVWILSCKENALCVFELPQKSNRMLLWLRSEGLQTCLRNKDEKKMVSMR